MAKLRDEQNIKDNDGWGLVHKAASAGNIGAIYKCKEMGGDVNRAIESSDEFNGFTPLVLAIQSGHIEAILFLARLGADLEMKVNGMTPLMYAIQHPESAIKCMEVLVGMGADVTFLKNVITKHGVGVLSKLNVPELCIEGVGIIIANVEIVQREYKSNNDTSPIIIKLDIKADIKWDIQKIFEECDIDSIIKFVQDDLVPEKEKYASNLFAGAAMQCSPEYTQMMVALIKAGYDISRKDSDGKSAYDLIKNIKNGIALCLLGSNSDISAQINAIGDDGMNDIHRAIKAGKEETLATLLSCGGNANIANSKGITPTTMVAQSKVNMHEMFYILVKNGANVNIYDLEQVQELSNIGLINPDFAKCLVAAITGELENPEMEAVMLRVDKALWREIARLDQDKIAQLISDFQNGESIDSGEISAKLAEVDVQVVGNMADVADHFFEYPE